MKIVEHYISIQIIKAVLLVALALLGLDLFFALVQELKFIGREAYNITTAISYILLTIPRRLYILFPWSALIGVLISLGALASHTELVVMQASSFSVRRISYTVLKAAAVLIIVVFGMGEGIAPFTENLAQIVRTQALSGGQTIQTLYGTWVRFNNQYIHIKTIKDKKHLLEVSCFIFDEKGHLQEAVSVEEIIFNDKVWTFYNAKATRFLEKQTTSVLTKKSTVTNFIAPEILDAAGVKHLEYLSIKQLWDTIKYRNEHELHNQEFKFSFWSKVLQPITILVMVFLAIPFIFGPLRASTMGVRILTGIILGFAFHTLNGILAPLALVFNVPPFIAVIAPIILFLSLSLVLQYRARI